MTTPESQPPAIDGYRHVGYLGSGGFGEVHHYQHVGTDAAVAIKILRDGALAAGGAQQLLQEARALGRLSASGPHPNIVAVQDVGVVRGRPYLVMELCAGGSWATQITDHGRIYPSVVLSVGIQIAGALHLAHEAGIVHRDIKPGNILLGARVGGHGIPKLADFGIAAQTAEEVSRGSVWLSRDYAAPEVVLSRGADRMSDIFSLAATLYHALSGNSWVRRPGGDNSVEALEERIIAGRVPPIAGNDVPEELQWLIRSAMHADPKVRARNVATARDFALRLQDIQIREGYDRTLVPIGDAVTLVPDLPDFTAPPVVAAVRETPPPIVIPDYDSVPFDSIAMESAPPKPPRDDRADTERARPIPAAPAEEPTRDQPRRRGLRRVALIAAAVLVVGGGVVAANLLGEPDTGPSTTVTRPPADGGAVPNADVLPVPVVAARNDAAGVPTFTWTYSPTDPGDRFNLQQEGQAKAQILTEAKWTPSADAGKGVCIRVSVIRNGRLGTPSERFCA
ncbi:serine/threonine protein kinase [Allocatelliglobosispora scoriae]|uniref:non-specific serine/threonine protein kinase n=1 Tax=Allocatelliglobosispora scoriae TaxID=643052 RepID=A0A841BY31_9ACTN|nr:serine/threonine-protein kinase [Allocatelliglobosispora scoriae]MBB5874067.1 serine/threonine protein kinase [Allocatelliglobosispora scoriae]